MYKTLKELNLEDDFLFAKVMSDKEICKEFLEKLLESPNYKNRNTGKSKKL